MNLFPIPGGQWAIKTPYSDEFVAAMHEVPGMRFDKPTKQWRGYPDAIELAVPACERHGLTLTLPRDFLQPDPNPQVILPIAEKGRRGYQVIGARWLVANMATGALLADDMGVGKTVQAISAIRAVRRPTVIICPSFARSVWSGPGNQLAKWWPEHDATAPVRVLEGVLEMPFRLKRRKKSGAVTYIETAEFPLKPPEGSVFPWRAAKQWIDHNAKRGIRLEPVPVQLEVVPLTVIHYDVLYAWAPHLVATGRILVFDEIHLLIGAVIHRQEGDSGPRRGAAARFLAERAEGRIGLTGTPEAGLPVTLFSTLDTLSPGRFGNYWQYTARYCGGRKEQVTEDRTAWTAKGVTNPEELRSRLRWMMLRRTKSEVAAELPERTRQILDVPVPKRFQVIPGAAIKSTKATRKALELAGEGKIPFAIEQAHNHARAGNKVVVYTRYRKSAEAISAALLARKVEASFIHGGVLYKQRMKRIAGQPMVLVSTYDVLSGGISLTYASTAIFAELHVSAHVILQVEARHHRIDQTRPVLYQYLIAEGTLDDLIKHRILMKLDAFEKNIGASDHGLAETLGSKSDEEVLADMFKSLDTEAG